MQADEGDLSEEVEHLPPCLAERAGMTGGSVFCHICPGVVLASAADAISHNAEKHSGHGGRRGSRATGRTEDKYRVSHVLVDLG